MQSETEPILAMFMNPEVTRQIQSSRDSRQLLDYLTKNHGLKPEMLDKLYLFAKFQYECGNYSGAAEYLHFHRFLVTQNDKVVLKFLYSQYASLVWPCFKFLELFEWTLGKIGFRNPHAKLGYCFGRFESFERVHWQQHFQLSTSSFATKDLAYSLVIVHLF